MLLSIVTGTWNRLAHLKAMTESVRRTIPIGVTYEIVVVDAGSTDGTGSWCLEQPDMVFIQQERLLGAIRAFDAGCEMARGAYLVLLNDDVIVLEDTLTAALVYLETHPDCGAVCFADNRRAPGYDSDDFKVQVMSAIKPSGERVAIPYMQTGMVRAWLAQLAGFWGSEDPIMAQGHTYGGDNYLSARILEMGYSIDPLDGCRVYDEVAEDGLREHNHAIEQARGSAYYRRYPNGVQIGALPKPDNPQRERLRIFYLPLYDPSVPRLYKRGLRDALAEVGMTYEHDYIVQRSPHLIYEAVERWQPHLILMQVHFPDSLSAETLMGIRARAPQAVVVDWVGDVYLDKLTAPPMLDFLKQVDLQLVVNTDAIPIYEANGIRSAYWQVAFEPVVGDLPDMLHYDILFLGNAYTQARLRLGAALHHISPRASIGIYGYGWENAQGDTTYDFAKGAALYRNCTIAISDNQYTDHGFVSNRLFEALANGAFLLQQVVPGLEALTGLKDGVHYVQWGGSGDYTLDLADLRDKCKFWLNESNAAKRREIAAQGERFVREHHSFQARVKELFEELLPRIQERVNVVNV